MPILAVKRGGRLRFPQASPSERSWRLSGEANPKGEDKAYRVNPRLRVVLCFLLILLELREPVLLENNY